MPLLSHAERGLAISSIELLFTPSESKKRMDEQKLKELRQM